MGSGVLPWFTGPRPNAHTSGYAKLHRGRHPFDTADQNCNPLHTYRDEGDGDTEEWREHTHANNLHTNTRDCWYGTHTRWAVHDGWFNEQGECVC